MAQAQIWEGTWEEILPHAAEIAGTGKRVTLIVPTEREQDYAFSRQPSATEANEQMLVILKEIEERHKERAFTDGGDTPRLLEEAGAGAMYGGTTADE